MNKHFKAEPSAAITMCVLHTQENCSLKPMVIYIILVSLLTGATKTRNRENSNWKYKMWKLGNGQYRQRFC